MPQNNHTIFFPQSAAAALLVGQCQRHLPLVCYIVDPKTIKLPVHRSMGGKSAHCVQSRFSLIRSHWRMTCSVKIKMSSIFSRHVKRCMRLVGLFVLLSIRLILHASMKDAAHFYTCGIWPCLHVCMTAVSSCRDT